MSLKKINGEVVRAVQTGSGDEKKKVKGEKLFPEVYSNVFLLARKKSGKTCCIFKILKKCVGPDTKLVFISSTVHKDDTYRVMLEYFRNKGNDIDVHTELVKGSGRNKEYVLLDTIKDDADEEEEAPAPAPEESGLFKFGKPPAEVEEEDKPKKRKSKKLAPELIFVLDDLGSGLRDKSVAMLLKKNRHYKSKVLIASQYLHDLKPDSIRQLDSILIWGGQPVAKLERIHRSLDLAIDYDTFEDRYRTATAKKYHFFYIDIPNERYRKDFTHEFI